jgi:hypothetical protein
MHFFAGQGFSIRILLIVQMELDMSTPASQPPSQGHTLAAAWYTHTKKYICKYINSKILVKSLYHLFKSGAEFVKLIFGNSEFVKRQIQHFDYYYKLRT